MARKNFFAKMRKARLKLTERSYDDLTSAGVPLELVSRLKELESREFVGEANFLENVRLAAGEEVAQKYKALILRHARRKPKFKVRYRNRCRRCGRSRAYYRKFMLCRLCFRELALAGDIPGVTKASW